MTTSVTSTTVSAWAPQYGGIDRERLENVAASMAELEEALRLTLAALDQLHREGLPEYYPVTAVARAALGGSRNA